MLDDSILFTVFLIFTGSAILATVGLFARQSLLSIYIILGILVGPMGIGLIKDANLIGDLSHIGIIFLLFLLGIDLYPQKLLLLIRQTTVITAASTLVFGVLGYVIATAHEHAVVRPYLFAAKLHALHAQPRRNPRQALSPRLE